MKKDYKKENKELSLKIKEMQEGIDHFAIFWEFLNIIKKIPFMFFIMSFVVRVVRYIRNTINTQEIKNNIMSQNPEIIAICHPLFRGVKSATYSLVKDVIEVPEVGNKKEVEIVLNILKKYNPKKIIISGYPKGYDKLILAIKRETPKVRIFFLSHASFTWYNLNLEEEKMLEKMLNLHKNGLIEKIGFVKKDPAEFFKNKGMNSFFVMNRFDLHNNRKNFDKKVKKINIGIFGSNMWHRNLLNQVVASQMIENTESHLNELGHYSFLDEKRVIRHGILPKEKFQKLLESMDINLYISFTDCFPMSVIESMSAGIPCLVSDTSDIFAWNKYLGNKLTVSEIDSPIAISKNIKEVLSDYKKVQDEIIKYLPILHDKVEESIRLFLS